MEITRIYRIFVKTLLYMSILTVFYDTFFNKTHYKNFKVFNKIMILCRATFGRGLDSPDLHHTGFFISELTFLQVLKCENMPKQTSNVTLIVSDFQFLFGYNFFILSIILSITLSYDNL